MGFKSQLVTNFGSYWAKIKFNHVFNSKLNRN